MKRSLGHLAHRILPLPVRVWLKQTKPIQVLVARSGSMTDYQNPNSVSTYEPDVCATIERIVKPGWVCVDVGAHVGRITHLLADLVGPAGCVVAFEAHPVNVEQLRHNLAD